VYSKVTNAIKKKEEFDVCVTVHRNKLLYNKTN